MIFYFLAWFKYFVIIMSSHYFLSLFFILLVRTYNYLIFAMLSLFYFFQFNNSITCQVCIILSLIFPKHIFFSWGREHFFHYYFIHPFNLTRDHTFLCRNFIFRISMVLQTISLSFFICSCILDIIFFLWQNGITPLPYTVYSCFFMTYFHLCIFS